MSFDFIHRFIYCHIYTYLSFILKPLTCVFPAKFMMDYSESVMERHLRSESLTSDCDRQVPGVCIRDLSTETFHSVVMQQNKVCTSRIVLLLRGEWRGLLSVSEIYPHIHSTVLSCSKIRCVCQADLVKSFPMCCRRDHSQVSMVLNILV